MKNVNILFKLLMLLAIVSLSACGGSDDPESEGDKNNRYLTNKSSKTWTVESVTLSSDTPYEFSGTVEITFNTGGTYTLTGGEFLPNTASPFAPIPASGDWAFSDQENYSRITLGDIEFAIILSETSLTLEYAGAAPKETDTATVTVKLAPKG
jgi:hypothetical protein